MNILLWILQFVLAFWNVSGGLFMLNNYQLIAQNWALNSLPREFWIILAILQVIFAIGVLLPSKINSVYKINIISAVVLALISVLGLSLYNSYQGRGIFWGLIPTFIALFVAYQRAKGK